MIPLPDEYTVRLVDLPPDVGGMISEDIDGHVNVYINARYSSTGQLNAAAHEYIHWLRDDLHSTATIRQIEGVKILPPLMKARDLRTVTPPMTGWADDVYHSLPRFDEY